jgi:hypothetical protein
MGIPLMVGFSPQLVVVSSLSVGIPLTLGFRLSRSHRLSWNLFTIFPFSQWNIGYHEAFQEFFSHNGILAITKPFTNFFFHRMEFYLSRSLSRIFSFTRWSSGYHGAFHEFFFHMMEFWLSRNLSRIFFLSHDGTHKTHDLGEDSFHIYHKEYLHRTHLVKNLSS